METNTDPLLAGFTGRQREVLSEVFAMLPQATGLISRLLGNRSPLAIVQSPADLAAKRAEIDQADRLLIIGSQDPVYDRIKQPFLDYRHVGCAAPNGDQIWLGGKRSQETFTPPASAKSELPVIVSFFTQDTMYEEEAGNLRASVEKLGLESLIRGVPSMGSWEVNCLYKPKFIWEVWNELKRPILWVDCDAVVRRVPKLLAGVTHDWGVHKVDRFQFAAGTLYFNQTKLAETLLRDWVARCAAQPDSWDLIQIDLSWEAISLRQPLDTLWLPQTYTKIFDRKVDSGEKAEPVIEHFQASRRSRPAVIETPGKQRHPKYPEDWIKSRKASRPRETEEEPTFYWE